MSRPKTPRTIRSSHRYQAARLEMFQIYGTVCVHCGHDGATDADHVVPLSRDPDQPINPHGMRPSHGVRGCPICLRRCNQERGNRLGFAAYAPRLAW